MVAAWLVDAVLLIMLAKLGGAGLLMWLLATVAALAWSFAGDRRRVNGVVSKDRAWVALSRVHPAFAGAITEALSVTAPVSTALPSPANAPGATSGHGVGGLTILPGR